MVGGCALRLCLDNPEVAQVTSIVRRTTGTGHPKLTEVVHDDFLDFTTLGTALTGYDLAIFCVGVYTGAVLDDEFKNIKVDYTLAFAEALKKSSPQAAFCFLSGQAADPAEESKVAFARYKGMAENALLGIGFQRVHIFHPGYISGHTAQGTQPDVHPLSAGLSGSSLHLSEHRHFVGGPG